MRPVRPILQSPNPTQGVLGCVDACMQANAGFESLYMPAMETLDVSYCHSLGDIGLTGIGRSMPALRKFSAAHCSRLTD
eukprot:scaffold367014_cov42-Prasinocladus_malaysianus.AAC.1